jgi:hypothetical protein
MTLSPSIIDGLPYVEGVLNYLAPMAERPMNLAYDPSPGVPRSTGEPEPHRVVILRRPAIGGAPVARQRRSRCGQAQQRGPRLL